MEASTQCQISEGIASLTMGSFGHDHTAPARSPVETEQTPAGNAHGEDSSAAAAIDGDTIDGDISRHPSRFHTYLSVDGVNFSANQPHRFHAYLSVNGESFSSPSNLHAKRLLRPNGSYIDHTVLASAKPDGSGSVSIQHKARKGQGGSGGYALVAETTVAIQHMRDFGIKHLVDKAEILATLQVFNKDVKPKSLPGDVYLITFDVEVTEPNVKWTQRGPLDGTEEAAEVVKPPMLKLRWMLSARAKEKTARFQLVVLPVKHIYGRADKEPRTYCSNICDNFEKVVHYVRENSKLQTPTEMTFGDSEAAKVQETEQTAGIPVNEHLNKGDKNDENMV